MSETLGPVGVPVSATVWVGGPSRAMYVWLKDTKSMVPLTGVAQVGRMTPHMLSAGGEVLIFERYLDRNDPSRSYLERLRSEGVFRLRFSTGAIERASFEPHDNYRSTHEYSVAPGGDQVAIAENRPSVAEGQGRRFPSVTLLVASFDSGTPRELDSHVGYSTSFPDTSAVQWSPDGRLIAFASFRIRVPTSPPRLSLTVFDAQTGTPLLERTGLRCVGSAGWSPDSGHLLVATEDEVMQVLDVTTGDLRHLPYFPGSNLMVAFEVSVRILGFLDSTTVMTMRQRGRQMILTAVNVETGEEEVLITCPDAPEAMPRIAQMPAEYWQA